MSCLYNKIGLTYIILPLKSGFLLFGILHIMDYSGYWPNFHSKYGNAEYKAADIWHSRYDFLKILFGYESTHDPFF
jgi:hypothetical protein